MAAPKRNAIQRERDLERVADLYCRGLTQRAIAQALNVCQQQVSYDLRVLQKRWQESALGKFHEYLARELARIDHVEAIAWQAWDRSCMDAETTSAELVRGRINKEGQPLPDLCTSAQVTKGQAGDPRFLEQVGSCIRERCRLFGLYAPTKLAPTTPDGQEEYGTLTDEEAATGLANLLAIMEARQLGPFAPGASEAAREIVDQLKNGHRPLGGPGS